MKNLRLFNITFLLACFICIYDFCYAKGFSGLHIGYGRSYASGSTKFNSYINNPSFSGNPNTDYTKFLGIDGTNTNFSFLSASLIAQIPIVKDKFSIILGPEYRYYIGHRSVASIPNVLMQGASVSIPNTYNYAGYNFNVKTNHSILMKAGFAFGDRVAIYGIYGKAYGDITATMSKFNYTDTTGKYNYLGFLDYSGKNSGRQSGVGAMINIFDFMTIGIEYTQLVYKLNYDGPDKVVNSNINFNGSISGGALVSNTLYDTTNQLKSTFDQYTAYVSFKIL